MMPHDAFRAPWKFLAQLFGERGRISKIGVVNIDVLRDDCFDPSADTIRRLALLNPDWPEQFVDVAGLDLRDREFSDRRVGVPFERRRPLIAMLLAPGRPALADVDFGAFLKVDRVSLISVTFASSRAARFSCTISTPGAL